jgi:glycosyltransferase involved in cell wall biosynthesis
MTPLVSAILPVRDRAAWIGRAVESVLAQRYPAVELIVIDDGSTDETPSVLDRYGSRIVRLHGPGGNAYAARNVGLARARGDLIAFIDSDDRWWPDHLSRLVPLFARPAVGLTFADTVHVTGPPEAPRPTGRTSFATTPPRRGRVAAHFLWGDFVPTTTTVVRRSALEASGPFDEASPVGADYPKWIAIARDHELDHADAPGADYTVHRSGISFDLGRTLAGRVDGVTRLLARETDAAHRNLLRRILVHLALHLVGAWAGGRTRSSPGALSFAAHVLRHHGGLEGFPWAVNFAYHLAFARVRRRIRAAGPTSRSGDTLDHGGLG